MGSDDSDNDEGFVPMKMEIKADTQVKVNKTLVSVPRPVDFQSRYIFGQGIFKYPCLITQKITTLNLY